MITLTYPVLALSRAVPSWLSSRARFVSNSERISCVSLKGNTWSVSCSWSLGHQQLAHCVVGNIVAVDTSSPSMDKKSIKTRERRTNLSAYRICISLPVKSLICSTRMSMHEWCSCVCRSARHSVVWATVATLDMVGIIPNSRQAYALPDTVLSLLRLATAKNRE